MLNHVVVPALHPSVCRQTIWRRKKKLALQALQAAKTIETPGTVPTITVEHSAMEFLNCGPSETEVQNAISRWPRIKMKHQIHLKQRILSSGR